MSKSKRYKTQTKKQCPHCDRVLSARGMHHHIKSQHLNEMSEREQFAIALKKYQKTLTLLKEEGIKNNPRLSPVDKVDFLSQISTIQKKLGGLVSDTPSK